MKRVYILNLLFFKIIILLLSGCSSPDRDKDGIPDEKDKCPDVFAKTPDGCPIKNIGNIHLFLDNSASMAGYFKNDAEYKTIVSDFATKIDKKIKPIDIWFIADSLTKYPNPVEQFSSDIATTKIADQKSSELHRILGRIAEKTEANDVSLFVSDCILSFPDEDIKANPEINKTEAPNALRENIFSTFSDLNKKGVAASVYAFKSRFYGAYYDYQNTKVQLNGTDRPFYLWVVANREVLRKFESNLQDISTFKPEKELHFGMLEESVSKYFITPQIERQGKWIKSDGGVSDVDIKKDGPLKICLLLNLATLPVYAQNIDYLQTNLQVSNNGCDAKFEVKDKQSVNKTKLKNESQLKAFDENTHAIIFTVNDMPLSTATINVSLPLKYDTWYLNWSTMDDKNILEQQGKTFAFEYLIDGVKEAYETKNKSYINFSFTLTK